MNKNRNSDYCQIKELLYPLKEKKNKKNFMKENFLYIKNKEKFNRTKRDNVEVIPEPYKSKEFKNIPSKVYAETQKWVNKKRPNSASIRVQVKPKNIENNVEKKEEINPAEYIPEPTSMFEKYYMKRILEEREKAGYNYNLNVYPEETKEPNCEMNVQEMVEKEYEDIKKVKLKGETPKIKDKGIILQKSNRNFIEENKESIQEIKKKNIKENNKETNKYHKYFGKTPKYLINFKEEAALQRRLEKARKEEAKNPKGTRLISEEERLKTLEKLQENKREIQGLIERMPISLGSKASKDRQEELFRKMEELDNAIETFSRKKVFVKIDE